MANSFTYTLGDPHDNQLDDLGLPCDGTVTITADDAVSYAEITFTINGRSYIQKIMNVPYQDTDRTNLYLQYFVNDQEKQLGI